MAVLGAQLVITMAVASVLQKLGPHYSLGRWLLCSTGLVRFLYPTDQELRGLAGVPKKKKGESSDTFHVPRNLDLQLEKAPVSALDVVHLRYYSEYQWLFDFAIHAGFVVILSEVVQLFTGPQDEARLSVLWCLLVVAFAFKILAQLALQYFKGEESLGERSICIVAASAYLLVAMVVLILDEKRLELGLEKAYTSFQSGASQWLSYQGMETQGPASKLILKLCLAVWCSVIGALYIFPGLRMAKMHKDSLKYCEERPILRALMNFSFIAPFILVVLWIRPICRDVLVPKHFSEAAFESFRLWCIMAAVALRVSLMPIYLQAYLNMAHLRLEEQKKEAGRITNKELQQKVAAVFYYLCVVALQYLAPILLILFTSLVYKTLGGLSWTGVDPECPITGGGSEGLSMIFTTDVFRGLFGFATWWCIFTWFSSVCLGVAYQSYFGRI
ncbi:transmembrane protein 161B [Cloeon dipterum]|uniref:transmembrane protein 161B n=1 Tax=Cloeon dipterum TaxID=197152 RepID=UPI00321F7F2A